MDGVHDMGGMEGFGPVVTADGELIAHEPWEVRVQAVGIIARAVSRHWIERLAPEEYLGSSYYIRWLKAAEMGAVGARLVAIDDLERWRARFAADSELRPVRADIPKLAEAERRYLTAAPDVPAAREPRFAGGNAVRVRRMRAGGHNRCPRYVRGAVGTVESIGGMELVPATEYTDDSREPVYTVAFSSVDLFGPSDTETAFVVHVDLWQQYLEAA